MLLRQLALLLAGGSLTSIPFYMKGVALAALGTAAVGGTDTDADDDGGGTAEEDDTPADLEGAGARYLEELTPDERNRDLAPELDDEDDARPARQPKQPAPAEAVTDEGEERAEDEGAADRGERTEEEAPEGTHYDAEGRIVRDDDGAVWHPVAERWILPAGGFAEGEAPEGAERVAADKGKKADAPKATKITLAGLKERNEEDLEIEIDDPAIAERIARLQNNGWRREDYQKRLRGLQSREERLEEAQAMMETDAIGFVLDVMPAENQIEAARALILAHFDVLAPEFEALQDPNERIRLMKAQTTQRDTNRKALDARQQNQRFARACIQAAASLVPDGTDADSEREFLEFANARMSQAVTDGRLKNSNQVKEVLASLVKRFGFDRSAAASSAPPARREAAPPPKREEKTPPAARPVTDRARAAAVRGARGAATPPGSIRRSQSARAAARRVAPPGAGAAPVQVPAIPDDLSVEDVGKHLRGKGRLSQGWTPTR